MRWILAISMVMCVSVALGQEGRLETVRSEVRTPQPESSPPKESSSCRDSSSSFTSDDSDFYLFLAKVTGYVVSSPFWVPPKLLGDDYQTSATFVAYPYADRWDGLMQMGYPSSRHEEPIPATWEHLFSVRASVEAGSNFDGMDRLGMVFLVDTMTRLGIGGGVHLYEEKRERQQADRVAIGDVNLLFRFAQSDRTQFRAGVGARFLEDCRQTDWGINFVYGLDWFPKEPVSVGMQLETGTLGNAWVFRATGRVGLVWKYSEVYAGYDYLHIGSQVLQGPMVGVRIWF